MSAVSLSVAALSHTVNRVADELLCGPHADVHDEPRLFGCIIGTARELTAHAARTPASIMLLQRCAGCCQKGSAHVNWPSSIIRS